VAQATLNQATAGLQSAQGSVTQKDIQAAQARVETARARVQQLTNGPKATDRDAAQARVRESEANLQSQRDALSAAKTNAKLRMDQVVNELTQAQAAYVTAKQRRDHVEATGDAPISSASLNEAQKREFYDAYVASAAQLRTAEQTVAQAQVDFDTALQQRLKKRRQDTNVLFASRAAFGFDAADIAPCLAPFSFDIFLFEL
jgi:HlyD family secretion protein